MALVVFTKDASDSIELMAVEIWIRYNKNKISDVVNRKKARERGSWFVDRGTNLIIVEKKFPFSPIVLRARGRRLYCINEESRDLTFWSTRTVFVPFLFVLFVYFFDVITDRFLRRDESMTTETKVQRCLKKFGFDKFRSDIQEKAILAIIHG